MKTKLLVAAVALILTSYSNAQAAPKADKVAALKITHGPSVEYTTPTTAIVAWSTNVSSGTTVLYGTDQNDLSHKAQAPWGALTHRVTLKNLQPNTTYFFKVDSQQGAGTGTNAESAVLQFQTKSNTTAQK